MSCSSLELAARSTIPANVADGLRVFFDATGEDVFCKLSFIALEDKQKLNNIKIKVSNIVHI
jgi:hypothetical protein